MAWNYIGLLYNLYSLPLERQRKSCQNVATILIPVVYNLLPTQSHFVYGATSCRLGCTLPSVVNTPLIFPSHSSILPLPLPLLPTCMRVGKVRFPSYQGLGFHLPNYTERKFSLLDKANTMRKKEIDNLQSREEERGSRILPRCSNKR